MNEAQLRDQIASRIGLLEAGLVLLDKERFIPPSIGTRSFIDLYARDARGHHVLIELKRSDASAREALHEVHKYVEAVKAHLGAREDEIRIIVASTHWRELLVPFSHFASDTSLEVLGLELVVDEAGAISARPAPVVSVSQGRFIAPWHHVNWYSDRDSLEKGIESIELWCRRVGVEDYLILVLRLPRPAPSEHQVAVRAVLHQVGGPKNKSGNEQALPTYEYIAYFAVQILPEERCLDILERQGEDIGEIRESMDHMDKEERLGFLHESVACLEPGPHRDRYEIGYPAKFTKFVDQVECEIQEFRRYGTFARNQVLADPSLVSELRGESGSTGQRLTRTVSVANRAHMAALRSDVGTCLEQNQVWRGHILKALDDIQDEFPTAELDVSIFNPGTGLITPYLVASREDGVLYVPSYSLLVRNPEPVRMYCGGLQSSNSPLSLRKLLDKYYEGDLAGLLLTMTWGGRDSRDADIIEDMGCAYRSFRCDLRGDERSYFVFRDDRWRPCEPILPITLFDEYLAKNKKLITQLLSRMVSRSHGGLFDAGSIDAELAEAADLQLGKQLARNFANPPAECDLCTIPFSEEKYMIDGKIANHGAWACMCADCFQVQGAGLGWGVGQLYLQQAGQWMLVGGFPPDR